MSPSESVVVATASAADLPSLVTLINDAYQVETGDSGVAFKHTLRLMECDYPSVSAAISEQRYLTATIDGKIVGCLCWERNQHDGNTRYHFGPFAVDPACQGKGVGRVLLQRLYDIARADSAASIDIEVVNWRSDILPLYEKLGYERIGEGEFPAPERITRPCHFIMMRKAL